MVRHNDEVLSALHDLDDDAGRVAEERVCHAFAGQIPIPDQLVTQMLSGRSLWLAPLGLWTYRAGRPCAV